jgi:hypothetical protein
MAEWSMAVVLKTTEPERVPGVRIPLSPPAFVACGDFGWAAAYGGSRIVLRKSQAQDELCSYDGTVNPHG